MSRTREEYEAKKEATEALQIIEAYLYATAPDSNELIIVRKALARIADGEKA